MCIAPVQTQGSVPNSAISLRGTRDIVYQSQEHKPPLLKHAYSNILNISPQNTESFQIKNSDIFHITAQNIDCVYSLEPPRRGGSNEYPQSMFLSRNKKNNVYSCKHSFYYIKVGFKGSKLYRYVFVMSASGYLNNINDQDEISKIV